MVFTSLLKGVLRDRISLGWSIVFPVLVMIAVSIATGDAAYRLRLFAGVLAMSSIFFAVHGTAFEVSSQRNRGVYKLLRASPFSILAFVSVLTLARGLITLASTIIVGIAGTFILDVSLTVASILLTLVLLVIGILAFSFLGFIVGNVGNSEAQVASLNNFITFPLLFLSETFYSFERLPIWLTVLRDVLPFNYFVTALRFCLEGSFTQSLFPTFIVLGFGFLFCTIAVVSFRWDPQAPVALRLNKAA
jgi:ABC-2 type transport system permease protein